MSQPQQRHKLSRFQPRAAFQCFKQADYMTAYLIGYLVGYLVGLFCIQ
ncbi:hypothetical protein [Pseudomonas sp.]